MINLKKYKFDELYEMSSGISSKPEQAGHGAPFLSFSAVFNNYFLPDELNDFMDTSKEEQKTYSVKKGDIFLTRTSEVIDELGMSSIAVKDYPKATYSGFLKRLRPTQDNVTYDKFMGFYLRSKMFRKIMTNNAVLTLRASLNEQIFSYLDLLLINYEEQVKAGDLLYKINSKIEINKQINAELEAMARTLYDYWFVQFDFPDANGKPYKSSDGKMILNEKLKRKIPDGWKVQKINEALRIGSGYPFDSKNYLTKGQYKIITIKNVQDMNLITDKVDYIDDLPLNIPSFCKLQIGDVLMSLTGNVGRLCLVSEDNLLLNQRVGKFLCNEPLSSFYLCMFLRKEERIRLESISTGSSQKNLSPIDAVDKFSFLPEKYILDVFNKYVSPIIKKILANKKENKQLSEFRDWLLPMLMNGQVVVK